MSDYISRRANQVLRKCRSRNPYEIAKKLGVHIHYRNDFSQLKGMYTVIKRNRFIFLNDNLPDHMKVIVCAHELGHDTLHRHLAQNTVLQDFMFYDMKLKPEYEANLFAAHILLDEDRVVELLRSGLDMRQTAAFLRTSEDLLQIKVYDMQARGTIPMLNLHRKSGVL